MRKELGILIIALVIQITLFAQPNRERVEKRVESMRIAYITNAIDLTTEQSQVFWPMYNDFSKQRKILRKTGRPAVRPEDMSEAEAEQFIARHFEQEAKRVEMERVYYGKVKEVLSAKQIVKLFAAEKEFKRQLVRKIQNRKRH